MLPKPPISLPEPPGIADFVAETHPRTERVSATTEGHNAQQTRAIPALQPRFSVVTEEDLTTVGGLDNRRSPGSCSGSLPRRAAGHTPRDRGSEQYDVHDALRRVLLERERAVRHQVENVLLETAGEVGIFDEHPGLEVRGQGAVGEVGRTDEPRFESRPRYYGNPLSPGGYRVCGGGLGLSAAEVLGEAVWGGAGTKRVPILRMSLGEMSSADPICTSAGPCQTALDGRTALRRGDVHDLSRGGIAGGDLGQCRSSAVRT